MGASIDGCAVDACNDGRAVSFKVADFVGVGFFGEPREVLGFFGGFAGALFAHYQRLISPDTLSLSETFSALTMTMLGGLGTLSGPVIGAVLLTFLSEGLRFVEDLIKIDVRLIIYGLLLIFTILFMRGGIVGLFERLRRDKTGQEQG